VKAIATARVPIITGIGHSVHTTVADAAAWEARVSPTDAAKLVTDRLQATARNLDAEVQAIRGIADRHVVKRRAARRRRLAVAAGLTLLAAVAIWRVGWAAVALGAAIALVALIGRRRRTATAVLTPQPAADTYEDVVQELGAIKSTLQTTAVTGEEVQRLIEAAGWLERRGNELLGRPVTTSLLAG